LVEKRYSSAFSRLEPKYNVDERQVTDGNAKVVLLNHKASEHRGFAAGETPIPTRAMGT
jgi:hypothetical protein